MLKMTTPPNNSNMSPSAWAGLMGEWKFEGDARPTAEGVERLLDYEAAQGLSFGRHFAGMCQYDARRFDGATLYRVLQVHRYMVAQGQIVQNPYYVRPEEFLASLRA